MCLFIIMIVLFLNHKLKKCGVYQYGTRLFDILSKSSENTYVFKEVENYNEYISILNNIHYDAILYNYHPHIMGWLNNHTIQKRTKNIGLQHDLTENDLFDTTLRLDTTLPERPNRYNIPRPIFENVDKMLENYTPSTERIKQFIQFSEPNVPVFGSFGFGFRRKGFVQMVQLINHQYDSAIIKLVMPHADTVPSDRGIVEECCHMITKPNIKLLITHDFFDEKDLLMFLKSNTMNVFLYETHPSAGVSSVIDYALSVKTPIAISNASWFRHIYADEICVNCCPLMDIMNTTKQSEKMLEQFSHTNLIKKVDDVFLDRYQSI
jgi:hypothetical protein